MTPEQHAALKAAINANPTWVAFPQTTDGYAALAQALNAPATPAFTVWRTEAPISAILDAINFALYTPNDVVGGSDTDPVLSRKIGWLLTAQTKQMNLQLMLQGRDRFNAAPPNARGGLRDAVIQLPTGAGGANTSPGGASGVTVLTACTRNATAAEKILATASQGSDTTGGVTARVLGFEGVLSGQDVEAARSLP